MKIVAADDDRQHVAECIDRLRAAREVGYATAVVDMSDLHVALAELDRLRAALDAPSPRR